MGGKLLGFAESLGHFIIRMLRGASGILGGIVSWVGGLVLLFGAYSLLGGDGADLALIGVLVICVGELMVFLRGLNPKERERLEEGIVKKLLKNMAFPLLWLVIYYFWSVDFLLAFGLSSGIRAVIENLRITASFYISL